MVDSGNGFRKVFLLDYKQKKKRKIKNIIQKQISKYILLKKEKQVAYIYIIW